MEERNSCRHPIDLAALLRDAFEQIPAALKKSRSQTAQVPSLTNSLPPLLGDNTQAIIALLLDLLANGVTPTGLAQRVSYAAARRIAQGSDTPTRTDARPPGE